MTFLIFYLMIKFCQSFLNSLSLFKYLFSLNRIFLISKELTLILGVAYFLEVSDKINCEMSMGFYSLSIDDNKVFVFVC